MRIKAGNWQHEKNHKTGKSCLVVYNDSHYGVIYNPAFKPTAEMGFDIFTGDIREWEVPEIFQFREGTTSYSKPLESYPPNHIKWEAKRLADELLVKHLEEG